MPSRKDFTRRSTFELLELHPFQKETGIYLRVIRVAPLSERNGYDTREYKLSLVNTRHGYE